jgi:hypothetical protein
MFFPHRQFELYGYRSQLLLWVPIAGLIQMSATTISAAVRASAAKRMTTGFTACPA